MDIHLEVNTKTWSWRDAARWAVGGSAGIGGVTGMLTYLMVSPPTTGSGIYVLGGALQTLVAVHFLRKKHWAFYTVLILNALATLGLLLVENIGLCIVYAACTALTQYARPTFFPEEEVEGAE